MSFLESLFKKKSYDKYGDILKKKMTTKEQRLEAIETLEELEAQLCVPQLLKRFELVVDSGLQDTKEKELCMNLIVKHGEKAKPFVQKTIETQRRVAWPIKIAEKIFSRDEYIELIIRNLNPDIAVFDEDSLERTEEFLLALKETKDTRIIQKAAEFLKSRDENVRMAALECLEEQAVEFSQAKDIILNLKKEVLTDHNSRFLGVIETIVKKHNWI